MATLSEIKSHSDVTDYFKPKVKNLKNIDQLIELPFYEQLDVIKTDQAFSGYAMSHKIEIVEKKKRSSFTIKSK